jgi:hypothetical protein
VKTEPKPFASLSSGLLARKGAARPAMRPQGFGQVGAGLEDLGWNDMGFEPPKPAQAEPDAEHDAFGEVIPSHPHNLAGLTPVESPVHNQQAEIAGRLSTYTPDDVSEEEEIDETAELYDPEAELEELDEVDEAEEIREAPAPVAVAPAPVLVAKPQPAPVARRQRKPRAAPGSKGKAAFTLRLDPDRHLKLRLACAVDGRSAQMLVTEALDRLLGEIPDLNTLAQKAKRKG